MVVGFVNSGMMTLRQAVGVIMGANIGTTITGQLIALERSNRTVYSIFGCCDGCFSKTAEGKKHRRYFSWSWCSFYRNGNDEHRNDAAAGFQSIYWYDDEVFKSTAWNFGRCHFHSTDPVFTGIGRNPSGTCNKWGNFFFRGGVCAVWTNIGTCITAVLASIGTGRNAKRTTIIHLSFNIIGTAVFTILCMLTPLTSWVGGFTPANPGCADRQHAYAV